jgi:hypothetical protein
VESTCWRCHAIFNPEATGKRCPNCGSHSQAWLAKLRFAAIDFIGPIVLIGVGLELLRDDPVFSVMFLVGSLVWAGVIYFQDTEDWVETPAPDSAPLSKPPMPDSWKRSTSPSYTGNASSQELPMRRAPGLTWAEQLLIAALVCGSIVYFVSRRQRIENFVQNGKISFAPLIYAAVILGLIVYAVQRIRGDERIVRDGVLTPGVLTGWYDKSGYTRTGYHTNIRIRYEFWTESGQKFEGSGTLISGTSLDSLTINQEPLKVFYLPQNPSKSVALCCTTSRVGLD